MVLLENRFSGQYLDIEEAYTRHSFILSIVWLEVTFFYLKKMLYQCNDSVSIAYYHNSVSIEYGVEFLVNYLNDVGLNLQEKLSGLRPLLEGEQRRMPAASGLQQQCRTTGDEAKHIAGSEGGRSPPPPTVKWVEDWAG